MQIDRIRMSGQILSVLTGAATVVVAWIVFFDNPAGPVTHYKAGLWFYVIPAMGAAGLVAAVAGVFAWPIVLLALAAITCLPFGLYLLIGAGLPLKLLGVSWLGYVAAGSLMIGHRQGVLPRA